MAVTTAGDGSLDTETRPQSAACPDGATIAYHLTPGKSSGVVFLTGFHSNMTGEKALALEALARARGNAFLRFDYTGHGQSSGAFVDGTIGRWADDALFALDTLTQGPQVLVGSSMGGWIMLLLALRRPERVAGLVGTAAAPDFTIDLVPDALTLAQRETMMRDGVVYIPDCYGGAPYAITRKLVDEGARHALLRGPIAVDVPVRLIHGLDDRDVPWKRALEIADRLTSKDVEIQLVKGGDHRLSAPPDLIRLTRTVDSVLTLLSESKS
ncbi:MAG: alpha/beta hydrolase [Rhodospirillales bacterium]|nr:alpha/beta hydrolase [Rhodospirillales bacterium]